MSESLVISIASFALNCIIAVVLIVVSFRRRNPIDETLQDYATEEQLERTRKELRCELSTCRAEHSEKCRVEHTRVNFSLAELYNENKNILEKITNKVNLLRESVNAWQGGVERQLGNVDARIRNLENKEHQQ